MEKISKYDLKLLRQLICMSEKSLLKSLPNVLNNYYSKDKVISTKDYIYAMGDIPVALVAHLDTVHRQTVQQLYHDQKKCVLWSPQGIGADDRAGVFAILKILEAGYRPSIIFCSQEESGGIGATAFIKDIPAPLIKTNYLIELDRQGSVDCVFYDFDNPIFEEYINNFGFITDWGTFSDIAIIGPAWKLPSVNLSIGYINEHTTSETLHYVDMFNTIEKVQKILEAEAAEEHTFAYVELSRWDNSKYWSKWYSKSVFNKDSYHRCDCCGLAYPKNSFTVISDDENNKLILCPECTKMNVTWCKICGKGYIDTSYPEEGICDSCKVNH